VIAIVASSGLGNLALPGLTDQPLSVDLASTWLAAAVLTDAVGLASVQWTLPVGASGLPLFVLGAGLQSNTLALSPPLGGVLR
jgi:biotin transporter BioY